MHFNFPASRHLEVFLSWPSLAAHIHFYISLLLPSFEKIFFLLSWTKERVFFQEYRSSKVENIFLTAKFCRVSKHQFFHPKAFIL